MSGVATAGLVLATFPLIISALEHYREGFGSLRIWWRFRTEYLDYINIVGIQDVLFRENLEELLSPIVSAAELDALLKEPGGEAWREPGLEERLHDRLPNSYVNYCQTIGKFNGVMAKLADKLGVRHGIAPHTLPDISFDSDAKWEREIKRFRFAFSKGKYDKLARALKTHNEDLQLLLGSSVRLATYRRRGKTRFISTFQRIRDRACQLNSILSQKWCCACPATHRASLRLEARSRTEYEAAAAAEPSSEEHFKVLFCSSEVLAQTLSLPWHWQAVQLRVIMDDDLSGPTSQPAKRVVAAVQHAADADAHQINVPSHGSLAHAPKAINSSQHQPTSVKKTRFAPDPRSSLSAIAPQASMVEIVDLCSALQQSQAEAPLRGYLRGAQQQRLEFCRVETFQVMSATQEFVSLETLLSGNHTETSSRSTITGIKLSRRERYKLAVTLASSLLQLHTTPWLGNKWSKKDIHFLRAGEGLQQAIRTETPFVIREYTPTATAQTLVPAEVSTVQPSKEASEEALFRLGVLLLELCFGQSLEHQHIRQAYLAPSGECTDMTDRITAWYWRRDVLGEAGPEFDDAIRRCLDCAFGPKSTNLADDEFKEAVYNEVVQPLEDVAERFI